METYKTYVKLRDLINSLEPEAVKASEKKNKAAARRLRKGLQESKAIIQNLRRLALEEVG